MLFEYRTPAKTQSAEIIEKKSRFTSYVTPVSCEADAIAFIGHIKTKHYDAAHNVYAYALREDNIARFSDDGEPSGTAGLPTLEVIRKEGLFDLCIVTTRYFGGTLLGAGGLVRAYTKSAKHGVDAAGILQKIFCFEYTVRADYTMLGRIQSIAAELGCILGDTEYSDSVALKIFVPHFVCGFEEKLIDAACGQVTINKAIEGSYINAKRY